MAMEAEWYRKQGNEVIWNPKVCRSGRIGLYQLKVCDTRLGQTGFWKHVEPDKVVTEPEGLPFLTLPRPDRVFTRAKEYSSGNYKHLPGTHIMSASGCWWGKCRFCVEKEKWEKRPVESVIGEIKECKDLGFREVFDDSGTFPIGRWLDDFCSRLKDVGMCFSCNMRLVDLDYSKLRKAGFRMLLVGVESINEPTLEKIQKGINAKEIEPILKKISEAGLSAHITCMFGYPFEKDEDSIRTLKFIWRMLRKGYAETAQASFYSPAGTTQNGYEISNESQRKYINKLYYIGFSPQYWFHRLKNIKDIDDIKYIWRGIKEGVKTLCHIKTN